MQSRDLYSGILNTKLLQNACHVHPQCLRVHSFIPESFLSLISLTATHYTIFIFIFSGPLFSVYNIVLNPPDILMTSNDLENTIYEPLYTVLILLWYQMDINCIK